MNRAEDWLRQAEKDLLHSKESIRIGHYEWAVLAAQQAAEKAVKALFYKIGADPWGHSISKFLLNLPPEFKVSEELLDSAKFLDKHYITARYPNGFAAGAPEDYYTLKDAEEALKHGEKIIRFCKDQISALERKAI